MTDFNREKIIRNLAIALTGKPFIVWNYCQWNLERLGYFPPDGEDRQQWAIATARYLLDNNNEQSVIKNGV